MSFQTPQLMGELLAALEELTARFVGRSQADDDVLLAALRAIEKGKAARAADESRLISAENRLRGIR